MLLLQRDVLWNQEGKCKMQLPLRDSPRVVLEWGSGGGQDQGWGMEGCGGVGRKRLGAIQPISGSNFLLEAHGNAPSSQAPSFPRCLCPGDPQWGMNQFPLLFNCDVTRSGAKSLLWSGVKSRLPGVTLAVAFRSPRPTLKPSPSLRPGLPPDASSHPSSGGLPPAEVGKGQGLLHTLQHLI